MTDAAVTIQNMDEPYFLSKDEMIIAASDGKTGNGGCEDCDAHYQVVYLGRGVANLRIYHRGNCPYALGIQSKNLRSD